MKRSLVVLLMLLGWSALAQTSAQSAQSEQSSVTGGDSASEGAGEGAEDSFLARYTLAVEGLNESVAALDGVEGGFADGAASLDNLERAARALRPLSQDTSSPTMVRSMEATFERARTAIRNESAVDLAVQVAVLKGGFRRLLYETAVRDANAGGPGAAAARFSALASEMGLDAQTQNALNAAANITANTTTSAEASTATPAEDAPTTPTTGAALRLTFEKGVAAALQEALSRVNPEAGLELSYPALAEAYGLFIPIQDSPYVDGTTGAVFSAAIGALVSGDNSTLESELSSLNTAAETLLAAQPVQEVAIEPVPVGAAPAETPPTEAPAGTAPTETVATEVAQVAPAETTPTEAAETPTENENASLLATPETASPGDSGADGELGLANAFAGDVPAALDLTGVLLDPARLSQTAANTPLTLDAYPLSESEATRLISAYRDRGFGSVDAALEHLYAVGARALVATGRGDERTAHTLLDTLRADYTLLLAPLVASTNPEQEGRTLELINRLSASPALRVQDVAVLLGQLPTGQLPASAGLQGGAPSSGSIEASVTGFWSGFVRLALLVFLGALAFVPLYLLNLAFGGGNRNWQWVGVALFLLLLPVMVEGLVSLGSLLAFFTGADVFNVLAPFSPFQSVLAQVVWVALTGLAILFAAAGLHGICVQFGLLGKKDAGSAEDVNPTLLDAGSPDAAIDWDEEF